MIALNWCRLALAGLLILQPLWFGWLNPPEIMPPWLAVIITSVPLLLVLPGGWHLRPRGLVIAGCLLLPYFCLAVMEAWANPPARLPAVVQIVLIAIYFTALPAVRKQPVHGD